MSASELRSRGSETVTWTDTSSGSTIVKTYSAAVAGAVLLWDGSGVAIAEPDDAGMSQEVVIFNADGSRRVSLRMPVRDDISVIGFHQLYYVGGELTAIVACVGRDFAYVIDPNTGRFIRSYETR
jgi:hypothetical protein